MSVDYKTYIKSKEWQAVRQRYFNSKLPQICGGCAAPRIPGFHLHHRTYKNLGKERLMDLVLLCQNCHTLVHKHHEQVKHKNKGLWYSTRYAIKAIKKELVCRQSG
jgi:5-methylcytosine-specific restriction endonuclease McrA